MTYVLAKSEKNGGRGQGVYLERIKYGNSLGNISKIKYNIVHFISRG